MHQEVPAIWRRSDFIDEQFIQAVILIPVCQGEVECSLNLPAELLRLALPLSIMGITGASASAKRRCEIWIDVRGLSTTTIVMLQEYAPVLRAHAYSSRTQTRVRSKRQLLLLVEAMGAGPAGRANYSAQGRLDSIGRRAIGDMVSSRGCVEFRDDEDICKMSKQHYPLDGLLRTTESSTAIGASCHISQESHVRSTLPSRCFKSSASPAGYLKARNPASRVVSFMVSRGSKPPMNRSISGSVPRRGMTAQVRSST